MGVFELSPSEFWRMHPNEFWHFLNMKSGLNKKKLKGTDQDPDRFASLYKKLKESKK